MEEPQRTRKQQRGVDRNIRKKKKREIRSALSARGRRDRRPADDRRRRGEQRDPAEGCSALAARDATRRAKEQAQLKDPADREGLDARAACGVAATATVARQPRRVTTAAMLVRIGRMAAILRHAKFESSEQAV